MDVFLKAVAGVLTAVILWLCIGKDNKGISVLLTIGVCTMIVTITAVFLEPIISFIFELQYLGELDGNLLAVVLKVVGISLLTEISIMICKDAGNETMGKSLQILSSAVVIWISIPVFEKLVSLLETILGTI